MVICFVALCALLFALCYVGTGGDERNLRSFYSYPKAVQDAVRRDPKLAGMVPPERSHAATFFANLVLFAFVLMVVAALTGRAGAGASIPMFVQSFAVLLLIGEGLNLFDLLVIDLLWWRNSPRVRFACAPDPALYRDVRPHVASFLRGIAMFALAALLATLVLAVLFRLLVAGMV